MPVYKSSMIHLFYHDSNVTAYIISSSFHQTW